MRLVAVLVAALLALASPAWATDYACFVDADADAAGTGLTNATSGGNHALKSVNLCEATGDTGGSYPPLNLSGHTFTVTAGANKGSGYLADTTAANFQGWTNTTYANLILTADAGSWAGTSYSATKYRLEVSNAVVLGINNAMSIRGLQIKQPSRSANNQYVVSIASTGVVIDSCFIQEVHALTTYYGATVLLSNNAAFTNYLINSIVIAWKGTGSLTSTTGANVLVSNGTGNVYSCTIVGGRYALSRSGGTLNVKNTYVGDAGTTCIFGTAGSVNMENCATSDTSADDTAPQDSVTYTTDDGEGDFVNVGSGTEDLAIEAESGLVNVGTTTSGESAPLNFTWDIRGVSTRAVTWDIGAYDYAATMPSTGGVYPFWLNSNEVIE